MSRVEKVSISKNFPASGVEPVKKMVAHLGRRQEGRVRIEGETSTSNPERTPKRGVAKKEKPRDDKGIRIVIEWPLGSGRKRY